MTLKIRFIPNILVLITRTKPYSAHTQKENVKPYSAHGVLNKNKHHIVPRTLRINRTYCGAFNRTSRFSINNFICRNMLLNVYVTCMYCTVCAVNVKTPLFHRCTQEAGCAACTLFIVAWEAWSYIWEVTHVCMCETTVVLCLHVLQHTPEQRHITIIVKVRHINLYLNYSFTLYT